MHDFGHQHCESGFPHLKQVVDSVFSLRCINSKGFVVNFLRSTSSMTIWAMKKGAPRLFRGWKSSLPSYKGILISQYKDPVIKQPGWLMECHGWVLITAQFHGSKSLFCVRSIAPLEAPVVVYGCLLMATWKFQDCLPGKDFFPSKWATTSYK